jgi:DNA-binding phage protein
VIRWLEDWIRRALDRRWRARSTPAVIQAALERAALDAERDYLAAAATEVITRLKKLATAEREDGHDREEIVRAYRPPIHPASPEIFP